LDRLQTDVRSSDPDTDSREAMTMLFGNLQGEDAVTLLSAELLGATGRVRAGPGCRAAATPAGRNGEPGGQDQRENGASPVKPEVKADATGAA